MSDPDPHLRSSFNGACSILGLVSLHRFGLQQGNGIPVETKQLPFTQIYELTHSSCVDVLLQIAVDKSFSKCDGAWCSQ